MSSKRNGLSNAFSTGGGGTYFEAHVQASFVTLMLTGGYAPCLPCWPISEIKLQGKIDGFETDDFIVYVKNPDGGETRKLLGQVKHGLKIGDNEKFRTVIKAAWNDFCSPQNFNKEKDIIVAISDELSSIDIASVQSIFNEAKYPITAEFTRRISLAKYHNDRTREKLYMFRETLKKANNDRYLSDSELHEFLRHFRILGFDLGKEEGMVLSLLHSHISQKSSMPPNYVWGRILSFVMDCNQNARHITRNNLPEDLLEEFKAPAVESIPNEIARTLPPAYPAPPFQSFNRHLAQAFLLGGWEERSKGDLEILTELTTEEYEQWIPTLIETLEMPESPLRFSNGKWTTKRNLELWQRLGKKLSDIDLDRFEKIAVKVLSEVDPAFDLPGDERYMAEIEGKVLSYSISVRDGIADALALLGSHPDLFPYCSENKTESVAIMVVRRLLENADWRIWGSLNRHLPLLAEAAPGEFLSVVEKALNQSPCPFWELFAQENTELMGNNYMTGLLWALESLAWDERYLTRVTVILGELSEIDPGGNWANRPKNSLIRIFLPWMSQTTASIEKRMIAINTLVKEIPESAWDTIINLLPNQHQVSTYSYKPRWRMQIPEQSGKEILMHEFWEQVSGYAELALSMADESVTRLRTLIEIMGNLPPEGFKGLLNRLESDDITSLPDEERTSLWSALMDFTSWHRRFADAKWALKENILKRIDKVASTLAPKDPINLHRRLFNGRTLDFYTEDVDIREQEKQIAERRKKALSDIYSTGGVDQILRFSENVQSPNQVGKTFGYIAGSQDDRAILPMQLSDGRGSIRDFVAGYIFARHRDKGWGWVDQQFTEDWEPEQRAKFSLNLPFCPETWTRVKKHLGNNDSLYWKQVFFNPIEVNVDYEHAFDKLLENERPTEAINCIYGARLNKHDLDHDRVVKALMAAVISDEIPHMMDIYHIVELIKALQDDPNTKDDNLFKVEWAYLEALNAHNNASPKLLEKKLTEEAGFFCEMIRLAFRSRHEEKRSKKPSEEGRKVAAHAFKLLRKWSNPPGTLEDGSFSPDSFQQWLTEMKEICTQSGHLEVAMNQLGETLIHTPTDPGGLWIHKTVAEALNAKDAEDMRSGFRFGFSNSRGVHQVDPTGQPERDLAQRYKSKADAVEKAGYHRLAAEMRELSQSYIREAKRVIAECKAEHELEEDGDG
ncbi:MAG: hypothetical protein RB296_00980 [Acidobacteriota bacterium]|nr:hypothetical protein [Acidobacteriota bacterium]